MEANDCKQNSGSGSCASDAAKYRFSDRLDHYHTEAICFILRTSIESWRIGRVAERLNGW